jgi:hypothetical protein
MRHRFVTALEFNARQTITLLQGQNGRAFRVHDVARTRVLFVSEARRNGCGHDLSTFLTHVISDW